MTQGKGAGWARGVFDMAGIPGLAVAVHGVPSAYGWTGHASGLVRAGDEATVYGNAASVFLYPWPTDAVSLEIVSDNAADDLVGIGGRTVDIVGIDQDWNIASVVGIELDGLTPVSVPGLWKRVARAIVRKAGSEGRNLGKIDVRVDGGSTDGDVLAVIAPGWSESSDGVISVPNGFVGLPLGISSMLRGNKSTLWADCAFLVRDGGGENDEAWRVRDRLEPYTGQYRPFVPPPLYTAKTDFEVRSIEASQNNVEVYVAVSLVIVREDQVPAEFLEEPTRYERGG